MTGEDLCAYVELRFYNSDGVTRREAVSGGVRTMLTTHRNVQFSSELQSDGALSFTCSADDPALLANPNLLEDGICKVALVLQAGQAPVEVLAFEMRPTSGALVAEAGGREVTVTAPGIRNLLSYAPVMTEKGPLDSNSEDARMFGWMSAANSYWYNASDWSTPLSYGLVLNKGLPTSGAYKITADLTPAIADVNLFRATFTLATAGRVRIYWLADDEGVVYLNSEEMGTSGADDTSTQVRDMRLSAGTHTIAAQVTNVYPSQLGFTCCVTTVDSAGHPDTVLLVTDTTHWKTHKVSGAKPGWSVGAILRQLLDEANALSVYGVDYFTTDFDGAVDSNGTAWPELEEKAFLVGQTTLADVVRELEELACDVRVLADGTLQAFVQQGSDLHASVFLQPGANLIGLTYAGSPVVATRANVRVYIGWAQAVNTAGVAAYGNRYMGITSGTSLSVAQGQRLAARVLDEAASPHYTYTATVRAVAGAVPFLDFDTGDDLSCPDRTGGNVSLPVVSISGATPEGTPGPVLLTLELQEP